MLINTLLQVLCQVVSISFSFRHYKFAVVSICCERKSGGVRKWVGTGDEGVVVDIICVVA